MNITEASDVVHVIEHLQTVGIPHDLVDPLKRLATRTRKALHAGPGPQDIKPTTPDTHPHEASHD